MYLVFVYDSLLQIQLGQEHEPKMNEYDIIETHVEDGDDLEETNRGENTTKTVEKEVLLQMTNVDSKTIKLGSNLQVDSKKQGKIFLYNAI